MDIVIDMMISWLFWLVVSYGLLRVLGFKIMLVDDETMEKLKEASKCHAQK